MGCGPSGVQNTHAEISAKQENGTVDNVDGANVDADLDTCPDSSSTAHTSSTPRTITAVKVQQNGKSKEQQIRKNYAEDHQKQTEVAIVTMPGDQNTYILHDYQALKDKECLDKRERQKEVHEREIKRQEAEKQVKEQIATSKAALKEKLRVLTKRYDLATFPVDKVDKWLRMSTDSRTKDDNMKQNKKMRKKLEEFRREKAKLLTRLSEIASARLRTNNPDIADLSDSNRVTKLAERLSELYDNEWTDGFEQIKAASTKTEQLTDKHVSEALKDMLKYSYLRCFENADVQRRRFYFLLTMTTQTDGDIKFSCPPELSLRLKEFQKAVSNVSLVYMKEIIKQTIVQDNHFTKYRIGVLLKQIPGAKQNQKLPLQTYLDKCTEVCWHMQIQDPPAVLEFKVTDHVPASQYRAFTTSGPHIDFVLWPVMLLHRGGPLVSKGVAQFSKSTLQNKMIKENSKTNR